LALCAISDTRAVGIDLERVRQVPESPAILGRWFTDLELADYERWSAIQGAELAFARLWTRKEAYLKGLGLGFNEESWIAQDPDPGQWHLLELPVRDGFAAALAVAVGAAVGARS
jgi:4'-phosphopantetheinyl transferase